VVARSDTAAVRRELEASLEAHGVPLRALHLRSERAQLTRPLPLRCDLKETSFARPAEAPAFNDAAARPLRVAAQGGGR
jgi:hypothetical protein